jgi:hypothetical protein
MMSIRQNGGVFGRNPTFNDVTIEGQLTFDGDIDINSDLKIDGNLDVIGGMTVDTDTLVVDASGNNVGIGTASPNASGSLHILRAGSSIISNLIANSGAILESGSASVGLNIITPNNEGGYINFGDPEDSNAGRIFYSHATNAMSFGTSDSTVKLEIDASGNTNVKTGNLVIGTSGKGIDFSATAGTGTSELFDDYEEGIWIPVLIGTTVAGTGTYTVQEGKYTKVGNLVTFQMRLDWSAHTGTGTMQLQGLPFTTSATGIGTATVYVSGVASSVGTFIQCFLSNSTTDIRLREVATGGGSAASVAMDTAGQMFISGHYYV